MLDSAYMHGYPSLYRCEIKEVEKPVRRYTSGPVSVMTPMAARCLRMRAAIRLARRQYKYTVESALHSIAGSAPVASARYVAFFGVSSQDKTVKSPKSTPVSIAA